MIIKQTMSVIMGKYDDKPSLVSFKPTDGDGYILLARPEVEVEFDMPSDIDMRNIKVAELREAISKTKADAQVRVERFEDEIQSLMALEA